MARRNLTNKSSVEDLLLFLEKDKKQIAQDTDVYKYISDMGLKQGTKFIPNSILYYMYVKDKKYKIYNRRAFFRHFSKFFQVKIMKNVRGYMLADTLRYTDEDYLQSRILTRNDQYGKKKGKKFTKKEKSNSTI